MENNSDKFAKKEEFSTLRDELLQKLATKEALADVKQDVSVLKQDVSVLKQDVSVLKQDVSRLTIELINTRQYMHENLVTKEEFKESMGKILTNQDELMKILETMRQEMRVQDSTTATMKKEMAKEQRRNDNQDGTLEDHDKRISRLEARNS
ncbi:hypothetical protein JXJ21_05025 [candidate division KSB1 bacterium]|nr:hypothetical protein [candidate division KSB1 bacterium]